jgi:hypothetical protein
VVGSLPVPHAPCSFALLAFMMNFPFLMCNWLIKG